jgi:hypothetical protein
VIWSYYYAGLLPFSLAGFCCLPCLLLVKNFSSDMNCLLVVLAEFALNLDTLVPYGTSEVRWPFVVLLIVDTRMLLLSC